MSDEILRAVLHGMAEAAMVAEEIFKIELGKAPTERDEEELMLALGLVMAVTHALRQLRRSGEQ